MADSSAYVEQLNEAKTLVMKRLPNQNVRLAYQSRSGSPRQPWLEPDIAEVLVELADAGKRNVIVVPLGFVSDHMEVLFDLDHEARDIADSLGLTMIRSATAGTHPAFVAMIRELVQERMTEDPVRPALGAYGPSHDICPLDCCLIGAPTPRQDAALSESAH